VSNLLHRLLFLVCLIGGTALLYLFFFDRWLMPYFVQVERVGVPSVQRLPAAQAARELEKRGLRLAIRDSVYSEVVPAGLIADQNPDGKQRIKKGRRVFVDVSKGPRLYLVPDVVGASLRDAQLQIEGNQLRLGEVAYVSSEEIPEGAVISQQPKPGTQASRGRPVRLRISSGSSLVPKVVPDVRGLSIEAVEDTLRKYEMRLGTMQEQVDNAQPVGRVLSQQPAPGERALPGSAIDLVLSVQAGDPAPAPPEDP
jgi:serine/threonine-protein kinase